MITEQTTIDELAELCHDLKAPLIALSQQLEQLLQTKLTFEQIKTTKHMRSTCYTLLQQFENFVDRHQHSHRPAYQQHIDTCASLQHLVALLQPLSPVPLSLTIAPDIPSALLGDLQQWQRLGYNLLLNAIKYTKTHHPITIDLACTSKDLSTIWLKLCITNEASASTNPMSDHGSTGLGLSICHKLTKAWGGVLTLEQTEQSVCVTLTLPFTILNCSPQALPIKLTILLIEDDSLTKDIIATYLSGHEVLWAKNWQAAERLIKQHAIDRYIVDLNLPDRAQEPLIEQLINLAKTHPVIAISAHCQTSLSKRLAEHRIWLLNKPFDKLTLQAFLETEPLSVPNTELIDWQKLLTKTQHNKALAQDLLEQFIAELPTYLQAINTHLYTDNKQLHHWTHKLYGASCFIEAPQLRQCALCLLETLSRSNPKQTAITQAYQALQESSYALIKQISTSHQPATETAF